MSFLDTLKNRSKQIDEAVDGPAVTKQTNEAPTGESKNEPAMTKTFSDGTTREWDDHSQTWVPLHPTGFQKAK
jgi:hypothetical protein